MEPITANMEHFVSTAYTVTPERLYDVLSTAFEGGSNYWATTLDYSMVPDKSPFDFTEDGVATYAWKPLIGSCQLEDAEEDTWHTFGPDQIRDGIKACAYKEPDRFIRMFTPDGDYDADDADAFLQCCIFGEVIYG